MNQELIRLCLRVPKDQASFLYFILESNENLAFYSTLKSSLGTRYRDVEIFASMSLEKNFTNLIDQLKKKLDLEVLSDEA